MKSRCKFRYILLAGERSGGSPLAQEFSVASGSLIPVADRACVSWVVDALAESECADTGLLCGPEESVVESSELFRELLGNEQKLRWRKPLSGPAASTLDALEQIDEYPVLLTTADHALLTPEMIDEFCRGAQAVSADLVVGLVPYSIVQKAYPSARRTLLNFSGQALCGSNLFAIKSPQARNALVLWQQVEDDRKSPWKIALGLLGVSSLMKYLLGQLSVESAFERLSKKCGCRLGFVPVPHADAAVDVDSRSDWQLADARLRGQM